MSALITAYVTKGALNALHDAPESNALTKAQGEGTGGELNYIEGCIEHAWIIDDLWPQYARRYSGNAVYEVAEPFGRWAGERLLAPGGYVSGGDALSKIAELFEEGCI